MRHVRITIEKDAFIRFSNNVHIFLDGNAKNKTVECSAQYCFISFLQLFLCGLCEDATPLVYYIVLVPQHKVFKDKHCFFPPRKPSKAASQRPSGFKHMPCNLNDLGSSVVRGCCCCVPALSFCVPHCSLLSCI